MCFRRSALLSRRSRCAFAGPIRGLVPMPMTADDVLRQSCAQTVQLEARRDHCLSIPGARARMASLFSTQQHWLMAHTAPARYFRDEADGTGTGLLAERFPGLVEHHGLAEPATRRRRFSRGCSKSEDGPFRRRRRGPAPPGWSRPPRRVLMALFHWHALRLTTPSMDWIAAPGWRPWARGLHCSV